MTVNLANTPTQTESQLHSQAAEDVDLHENVDKTDYMCFKEPSPL